MKREITTQESLLLSDFLQKNKSDMSINKIKSFIKKNLIDINQLDKDGKSLLHIASRQYPYLVSGLLKMGANIHTKDFFGGTPLMDAMDPESPNTVAVEALLKDENQVDLANDQNWTALMYAVGRKKGIKFIQMLLDKGANPNIITLDNEKTALHLASWLYPEAIIPLLEKGADPYHISSFSGLNILQFTELEQPRSYIVIKNWLAEQEKNNLMKGMDEKIETKRVKKITL